MDFFAAQDDARKNTKWLVLLFALAVISIIVLIYLAVVILFSYSNTAQMAEPIRFWRPELFLNVSLAVSAVILFGSLYKSMALAAGGGAAVAESLGGRLVSRDTRDPLEQRLINVVDEMAIASGVPVPGVYVLDQEQAINAFAAGSDIQNAVVAVTRGCLQELNRDELQGVIAHEFSHILNGDMRINIRLMGIIFGILMLTIIGRIILHSGGHSRSRSSGGVAMLGLALLLVGYVGLFFGNLIKAAVSRQREFLADAAAVQFTRNPAGLAGALKRIGGFTDNRIQNPNAEQASHMFFDTGVALHLNLLATHPPLEDRIRRLEPMFQGKIEEGVANSAAAGLYSGLAAGQAISMTPEAVSQSVGNHDQRHLGYAHDLLAAVPASILNDVHDPQRARAVIYAMLAVSLPQPSQQLPQLLLGEDAELIGLCGSYDLNSVNRAARLPLVELAIPAIREIDGSGAELLLQNCRTLIDADSRVTVFEFAVLSLLQHALAATEKRSHGSSLQQIAADCTLVFSVLAYAGHEDTALAERAFAAAWHTVELKGEAILVERKDISLPRFSEALANLNALKYRFKAKLIEACTAAISSDGKVTITEAELLRAIGARLDCPIPPLLPGSL
jgi:Zn-dependent protease with chaperone function